MTYEDYVREEVAWYMVNGLFGRKRIRKDRSGNDYVLGDAAWNGNRFRQREYIEDRMSRAIEGSKK